MRVKEFDDILLQNLNCNEVYELADSKTTKRALANALKAVMTEKPFEKISVSLSLGLPDSLLGSAWPMIRTDFDVPLSYMGLVSMVISGGTIFSGLMSERITKKFGTRAVTTVSVLLTAVALFGIW